MHTLLFQLQAVAERFTHALGDLVIAMGVGVKGDGIDFRHINFSVHHNALIGSDIDHLADDAASVFIVLILDESALQAEWKSAGINGCVKEIIMIQRRTPRPFARTSEG